MCKIVMAHAPRQRQPEAAGLRELWLSSRWGWGLPFLRLVFIDIDFEDTSEKERRQASKRNTYSSQPTDTMNVLDEAISAGTSMLGGPGHGHHGDHGGVKPIPTVVRKLSPVPTLITSPSRYKLSPFTPAQLTPYIPPPPSITREG